MNTIDNDQSFLAAVAADLYEKMGSELVDVAVVFPNKRASLFFNEYLAKQAEQPIWSPSYMSIKELMTSLSSLRVADPIKLLCTLYEVFRDKTQTSETFDEFYYWGELLLSDFDDLDKNRVQSEQLFKNLHELHELTGADSFLDDEQREALTIFFRNYSIDRPTELKQKFATLWERFGAIYTTFKERLEADGLAYEGMLYRKAVEQLDAEALPYRHYLFVGFNVLNQVETLLFESLQKAGKAQFYWDYDQFYTQSFNGVAHEAGEFILRNLARFGNELPEAFFDRMRHNKRMRFINSSTESGQVRYLSQWFEQDRMEKERDNAVVLCNESLLLPLMHNLPQTLKHVNVTMGFPLIQTPAYSLINTLLEMQFEGARPERGGFAREQTLQTLRHPYVQQTFSNSKECEESILRSNTLIPKLIELQQDQPSTLLFSMHSDVKSLCQYLLQVIELTTTIYRTTESNDDDGNSEQTIFDQLFQEALFKCYTTINRLYSLIEDGTLHIKPSTLRHLMQKLLTNINIPFHGEPAIGLQVMGVLETRTLDFKKLLLLSVNEGMLPKAVNDTSFIPYNLRKAFGMTTIEHKNAVYAYYFYRMIQRAEDVTLIYNSSTEGLVRGEMSRFMLQLQVEWPHPIEAQFLQTKQFTSQHPPIFITQTEDTLRRLCERFDANKNEKQILSPTAINCYLDCSLRFYFRYIVGLRVNRERSIEVDSAMFGTIFHHAAEQIYKKLAQRDFLITKERLETVLNTPQEIEHYVDQAFKVNFYKVGIEQLVEYSGSELLKFKVIVSYLKQLLRLDISHTPFSVKGLEQELFGKLSINVPTLQRTVHLRIGGIADRIDQKDDLLRIVDYKTGGTPSSLSEIEDLFISKKDRQKNILQAFIYANIASRNAPSGLTVAPSVLYIGKAAQQKYNPIISIKAGKESFPLQDFSRYATEFQERLTKLIESIFAADNCYKQTEIEDNCKYCDFRNICNRNS